MSVLSIEDRDVVADTMARALQAKAEYRSLQKVQHPHRGERWVEAVGKATYDERGLPVRVTGVVTDVTEQHLALEEMKKLRDMLAAEVEAHRRLHGLTLKAARSGEELTGLLRDILAAALEITSRDLGAIHLYDASAGVLRLAVSQGVDPKYLTVTDVPLDTQVPSAICARLRERVIFGDVAVDLAGSAWLPKLLEVGVRAAQATPLLSRSGDVIGTLTTHARFPGRPSERELRLLDMLSRTAADMIEWSRTT
jgi:hypothetical protein